MNVLVLCGTPRLKKLQLVNEIVQSVDSETALTSYTVTTLLQCAANLPDTRSNGLGEIITNAQKADPRKVAEHFSVKVIPLLDPNMRKLAVLAICDMIKNDEGIPGDTIVDMVSGATKKTLTNQSQFVLSCFLAGVFLFTTTRNNRVGKDAVDKITGDYVRSFEAMQDTIAFIVPQADTDTIDDSAMAIERYVANALEKYGEMKTLLYKDEPKAFYGFYVPNHIEHKVGRGQPTVMKGITAAAIIKISNFLILDGVGGLGKSMMLRHLLLSAINEFRTLRRVPVLISLKDYSEPMGSLFDYISARICALSAGIDKLAITGMLREGSLLLLFDGLDEIDSSLNGRFERAIEEFTDTYPKNSYVISSRPYQDFVSFSRFTVLKIRPFTREQSIELIDKLEFRPDEPAIKEKFRRQLEGPLSMTHRSFMENPLLLTIMLLTFELFAEIPTKMHVFYRKAFITLYETHDASKGAYRRVYKTKLSADEFSAYLAEFCFHTYKDMKFEFNDDEFERYFGMLRINEKTEKPINADDFAHDLCTNLCLMYQEGGKYHFTHRSFQEYFCALFFSKQKENFLEKLGDFFERRHKRLRSDQTFNMLWDMIPDKVETCILIPYLEGLFAECDKAGGYWAFLKKMYPRICYENGEILEWASNEPKSYIFGSIIGSIKCKYTYTCDDLPGDDAFLVDEFGYVYMDEDSRDLVNLKDVAREYPWVQEEPDVVGATYDLDVERVCGCYGFERIRDMLENDEFIYKAEYNAARVYLGRIKATQEKDDDYFIDLLELADCGIKEKK